MQFRKTKISWYKQTRLIEHFIAGTSARQTSELVNLQYKTVWRYFHRLRHMIAHELEKVHTKPFTGEIELDESYFGGRYKGKRGRGAENKTIVFGILQRGGSVYTQVIPDSSSQTIIPIITDRIQAGSVIYTDYWRAYNRIPNEYTHRRINHKKQYASGLVHINGIENFWRQAKRYMKKYNGVPHTHFLLYIKTCEWFFNNRNPKSQKRQLKQWAKQHLN